MKRLLNTLYVTSPNRYVSLDGENVVVLEKESEIGRVPLHNYRSDCDIWVYGSKPGIDGSLRTAEYWINISEW